MATIIANLAGTAGDSGFYTVASWIWNSVNYGQTKQAQTFVVSTGTWSIPTVLIRGGRTLTSGSPQAGTLTLEIRQDSQTGTLLGSSTKDRTTISLKEGWINFSVTGVTLSSGNTYCLVLYDSAGFQNDDTSTYDGVYWTHKFIGFYSSGNRRYYNDVDGWTTSTGDCRCYVYGDKPLPSKPINPTPANEATEVDFSGFTLSWVNGGGATSYDVYIGASGSLVEVSTGQSGTSYVTNIDEVPYNQVIYWRVDAVNSVGTTTGDTWNFDARPGAAITPYPGNATSGITLDDTTASWESGSDNTINYDIYFRPFGEFYELVDSDITDLSCTLYETNYLYGWLYFWSVVAKNKFGTYPESAPDGFLSDYEWYFNAMVFSPVLPTGVTMVDGKPASGTTGTPTGENNMMTTKRLVAAAQNKIWYEAI